MGLTDIYLDYINESIGNTIGELRGKRMLELGNQEILNGSVSEATGKEYFGNRGAEHISVDLNGLNGAVKVDLARPIKVASWRNYFDIVTNSGTSEHIEPKSAQYECFMNIHNCLRPGGIAIHLVPDAGELEDKGCWKNHCNNYYSAEFFKMLARNNDYKLISVKILDGMRCTCIEKGQNAPFMKNRKEFLRYIVRKEGGNVYPGARFHGLSRLFYIFISQLLNITRPLRHRLGLYRRV